MVSLMYNNINKGFRVCFLPSYVVGGPDVVSTMEGRGSCGAQESIEDDPFVVAASMQALDSTNGRKKKLDATINYGYEPEGTKNNACHCFSVFTCRIKFIESLLFVF